MTAEARRMASWRPRITAQRLRGLIALCACVVPANAFASEYHGQVMFGGIPVPGAVVTVTAGDKHFSAVTDTQGLYQFPNLPDGTWKVHVEMREFAPRDGEAAVSSSTPQGMWELDLLPLQALVAQAQVVAPESTAPSPSVPAAPASSLKKSSKTAGKNQNENGPPQQPISEPRDETADGLLVNGSENNANTSKYSIAPAFGNQRPGVRALYNGSLGVIAGNSVFDARPYSLTGLELPKDGYNRITGVATLGGPIRIPHLLPRGPNFFIAYQWTRSSTASTAPGLVPTLAERNGDLSGTLNAQGQPVTIYNPATGLPYSGSIPVSAQAAALLKLYPLPNLAGSTRYNYETPVLSNAHIDAMQMRLDKSIGRRDSFFGGFSFSNTRADNANLFAFRDATDTLGMTGNVHWSHRLPHGVTTYLGYTTSRLRTDIRPNFEERENVSGEAGIAAAPACLPSSAGCVQNGGSVQDAANWGPPTLAFSNGISTLSDGTSAFNRNRSDSLAASAQWIHRKHNVTFGGDFRRQEYNEFSQQNPRGTYTFTGVATQNPNASSTASSPTTGSALADFLVGTPDTSAIAFGNPDKYFRQSVSDLYINDDWRLRPELTVNAGLRWDYGAPMTELFGRLVNIDVAPGFAAATPVLGSSPKGTSSGQAYPTSLVKPDRLGFQPRLGISWRPLPASTLVVRAGYGIYDDTSVYLSAAEFMSQQAPLSTSVSVSRSAACSLALANGFHNCGTTTPDTFAIDPNYRVGYAQVWQLALQRDLPGALVLSATYLGTKGTRGMQQFLPNTYAPGGTDPCPLCPKGFTYRSSNGDSNRESGQVQLRRRLRSGLTASLQYTYSKSLDNDSLVGAQGHTVTSSSASQGAAESTSTGTPTIAQNWLDLRHGEKGLSNFDQRHLLKASLQYTSGMGMHGGTLWTGWRGRLLKQWTAATTLNAGSGLPETPIYFEYVPNTGTTGTVRPNVTGAPIYRTSSTPVGYFLNASAYSAPAAGQWGDARRNSIIGPDQFSMDGSLSRTFKLKDPMNFDLRVDATNLLNHPVFTSWDNTVNSTTFGEPVSVSSTRTLQITGRLRF